MVILGNTLLESITLMYLLVIFGRYLAVSDRMNPCSIGCVMDIVLGGKKIKFAAIKAILSLGMHGMQGLYQ